MVEIKICIDSTCFLKKSPEIIEYLENKIKEENLENKIILSGSFCAGKCNRIGATVFINDELFTGVTTDNIKSLRNEKILSLIK